MAAEVEPGKFGAFGKIPALGDFFRMALTQSFIEPWDAFLQAALVSGRSAKAEAWTECYMTAPIWRFSLAAGVAGPEAMVGVLMPSVDRVGRLFPLTLAAPSANGAPLAALVRNGQVLDSLEEVALDALDDTTTREALAARLEPLRLPAALEPAVIRASGGGQLARAGDARQLALDLALAQAAGPKVIFTTALEGASRLMALPDLPQGEQAAALFDLEASFWGEGRG